MRYFSRRLLIAVTVVVGAIAGWFLLVDLAWFEEQCPDCRYARTAIGKEAYLFLNSQEAAEFGFVACQACTES